MYIYFSWIKFISVSTPLNVNGCKKNWQRFAKPLVSSRQRGGKYSCRCKLYFLFVVEPHKKIFPEVLPGYPVTSGKISRRENEQLYLVRAPLPWSGEGFFCLILGTKWGSIENVVCPKTILIYKKLLSLKREALKSLNWIYFLIIH